LKFLDASFLFSASDRSVDLKKKSIRGGLFTIGSQIIVFILGLGRTMVLARLLIPEDFGIVGMIAVVIGFAEMFKNAGLSIATVQRNVVSEEQISNLFWFNVVLSWLLGVGIFILSPFLAWFYQTPELTKVAMVLAGSFILSGFSIQHTALMRRHMLFGRLSIIQIVSNIVCMITMVYFAWIGWRYWALVMGSVLFSVVTLVLTFACCPWVPGKIKRGTGVKNMLKFGGHITGFNFVNYFARNADNLLIGKFLGAGPLGLYSKAYQIVMMPVINLRDPVYSVAIPALSILRNDPEEYRKYYGKIVFLIALLTMPLMAFVVTFSEDIIVLVFVGHCPQRKRKNKFHEQKNTIRKLKRQQAEQLPGNNTGKNTDH